MLLLPESPRFLLYKGNENSARKSLSRLISQPADSVTVSSEVAEIEKVSLFSGYISMRADSFIGTCH